MKAEDTVMPLEYSALDSLHCAGLSDRKILVALKAQAKIAWDKALKAVGQWILAHPPNKDDNAELLHQFALNLVEGKMSDEGR